MRLTDKINSRFIQYDSAFQNMIGKKVTYSHIRRLAASVLKPWASVKLIPVPRERRKSIALSAEYDTNNKKITVFLYHTAALTDVHMSAFSVEEFRHVLAQKVQHELIHKDQHKKIGVRYSSAIPVESVKMHLDKRVSKHVAKDIMYFSDKCELDAYGHDIAYEIKWRYPHLPPKKVLQTIGRRRYAPTDYKMYVQTFKGLEWENVRQHLLGRAYKWLPQVTVLPELCISQ